MNLHILYMKKQGQVLLVEPSTEWLAELGQEADLLVTVVADPQWPHHCPEPPTSALQIKSCFLLPHIPADSINQQQIL